MSLYVVLKIQAELGKAYRRQADPLELQTLNPGGGPAERLFASHGLRRNIWSSFMGLRRRDDERSEARRCGSPALADEANALTLWTLVAPTRS